MGTRSTTRVYDEYNRQPVVCMYRQMDGYPEGHGKELAEFLLNIKIINGFGHGEKAGTHANGMDCLAAQMVVHFKGDDLGNIYLSPIDAPREEYDYIVKKKESKNGLDTSSVTMECIDYDNVSIFKGTPQEFLDWIKKVA